MRNIKIFISSGKMWIIIVATIAAVTGFLVVSAQALIPRIQLSSEPLYATSGGDKPTLALALSVEYPTIGAQYKDSAYSNSKEYLGYYNSEFCYTYNSKPTEAPATGMSTTDYKRFDIFGKASDRMCSNAFSGNFLNWASNSAIDMLRLALSGGDRYIDTATLTVLQRAVVPNGDPVCMWNSNDYPAKQLQRDGGGTGLYFGAVPNSMIKNAGANNIWVSNTLNRIYFSTTSRGSCTDTIQNNLGTPVLSRTTVPGSKPNFPESTSCVKGSFCGGAGRNEILFGSPTESNKWVTFVTSGPITCSSENFPGGSNNADATCFVRPYTGTIPAPAAPNPESSDAFFYARVNVCNSALNGQNQAVLIDERDYKLCTRYPNGGYKPTGSIQKYSDQLKLAAFGYLMDQTASYSDGRYGGVLRAPMKFVGGKTFDISGQENSPLTGNPKAEWDVTTGVFALNPDGDTTQAVPISGVINYLNKFGRTGPVAGKYKKFDPVGELYGESLRYLQGLQPTLAAVSNITPAMYDGFPASQTWTDPYGEGRTATADYSCLKSNIVVIGDVNTHDSARLFTRVADLANNLPNFSDSGWKGTVANFEANKTSIYLDGQSIIRTTSNPNITNLLPQTVASGSQVLTGQAYWAHTHDIRGTDWIAGGGPQLQRPGLRVKSYFFDVNENTSSYALDANGVPTSISTNYRQNKNQFFTAAKYGGFESDASNSGARPYNTYGNPFKKQNDANDNNVWQDPLNPNEASTYYLQSNARGVLRAFDSIFEKSTNSARNIAGSSVANKNITSGGTFVYQASFDTSNWTGDVLAFPITAASGTATIGTTATWQAATRLDAMTSPVSDRKIFVGRAGASSNPAASSFTWAAIDQSLRDNLAKLTPMSVPDSLAENRVKYLRGDKTLTQFRTRAKLLGDIVNSGVAYSGAPAAPLRATAGFSAFQALYAARKTAVFAGANDGMLHAFDAATGDELFGYIPSSMGPKLAALTAPSYNSNHQLYVDATPVVAEAKVGPGDTAADWKTVLASGMGGGASGIFALDISDPGNFSAANVMWEFTRADDADMGFVVGTPRIITLRTSTPTASSPTFRSFVAVASGVNNYVVENGIAGGPGHPVLFLLALDKQVASPWTASVNYYKITLPVDAALSATNPTGLINFKPSVGFSGVTEQIYMGDLHGKLWKLDFTSLNVTGPADWNMGKLSSFNKGSLSVSDPYPLYIARTAAGNVQPISMAPLLAAGPVAAGLPTTVVGFGTGKYLESGDKTSVLQQSFYAVYDNGTPTSDGGGAANGAISSRKRLQQGTADVNTLKVTVGAFRYGRASTDTPAGTPSLRSGWYFDFPVSGERIVSNGSILGDNFLLSSLIPVSVGAAGSCTAAGGSGNSYELNIDTGNGKFEKSTVGLLGETLLVKVSEINQTSDSTGKGIKFTSYQRIRIGSTGASIPPEKLIDSVANRRLTWRQINNYQDLRLGK